MAVHLTSSAGTPSPSHFLRYGSINKDLWITLDTFFYLAVVIYLTQEVYFMWFLRLKYFGTIWHWMDLANLIAFLVAGAIRIWAEAETATIDINTDDPAVRYHYPHSLHYPTLALSCG
jgi:hypothetical protein